MKKILVATSCEESSLMVAEPVIRLAANFDAEIVALHVRPEDESESLATDAVEVFASAGASFDVKVTTVVRVGDTLTEILAQASLRNVAAIIIGASLQSSISEWASSGVTQQCDVPVLVLPQFAANVKHETETAEPVLGGRSVPR